VGECAAGFVGCGRIINEKKFLDRESVQEITYIKSVLGFLSSALACSSAATFMCVICAQHGKLSEGSEVACLRGFCTSAIRKQEVKDVHARRQTVQDSDLSDRVMFKIRLQFQFQLQLLALFGVSSYAEEVCMCSCPLTTLCFPFV